jgi:hypothetical protein
MCRHSNISNARGSLRLSTRTTAVIDTYPVLNSARVMWDPSEHTIRAISSAFWRKSERSAGIERPDIVRGPRCRGRSYSLAYKAACQHPRSSPLKLHLKYYTSIDCDGERDACRADRRKGAQVGATNTVKGGADYCRSGGHVESAENPLLVLVAQMLQPFLGNRSDRPTGNLGADR